MLFTSKSNTNATTNTTATETTETTNNNGGLLKGVAIAVGTVAGIGLAAFGGKKAYNHFHVKDENNMEDVTVNDEEGSENVTENNETVESFNEVNTEETNESAHVEAEAKTEETVNEAPVDEHSETEKLVNQLTEEASKCASINTATSLISSIKKMDETVGSVAGMYRTIGDNAKIDSAIAELYKAFNSYWNNLDTKISNCDKESFAACASEIDDVNNAWWDMQYIQMNRLATETMSYVINKYAHMERVAKRKEQKATLAAETQAAQKSSDETQAEEKKSAGETKTTDTRNIEATAKESVAKESLEKRLGNLIRLQKSNDADADKQIMRDIAMVDFNVETLRKLAVSDIHDIETVACRCGSLAIDHYIKHASSVIKNTNLDNQKSLINIRASLMTIKSVVDTLENIVIYPKTRVHLEKVIRFADVRENELFQIKLEKTMSTENKVVDETQATTEEVPSETQIGNSEVISDDGETVTLKASVPEDSVQNVMDVIDIVSKIPNREDPEKNDMPYYIRVIGGRIAGITEPEATFLAYNDKTKSNDFIDACVSLCNMVGNGICNLADQKSDPIGSLGWINRSYDELIASGVIDNTYNPQAMRDVLTKARNEATRVLTNMVKKSDETRADDNKVTGETKTVTNGKLIDEINTYVHTINVMAFKQFTMVSTNSFVEKLHKIDECISLLDNSEPSKAIKRNAYKNINITVRLFCTSKLEEIDACANHNDIVDLCADVRAMLSLNLTNVELSETTLNTINNAITSAKDKKDKVDEIVAKNETQDLAKASGETKIDANSSGETKTEETLTYTMSDKIKEAVQQSDETAATAEPESKAHVLMSPEASEMARKLQEAGELIRAKKWSDASEFYKTQLTPYLADDGLTEELREEIMSIKTKATNMMMSQKQLEAKQKAASAKASKRKSSKRRRH